MKIDQEIIDSQEKKYNQISSLIWNMERDLRDIKKHKGRSLALEIFEQKVDEEHRSFKKRVRNNTVTLDNRLLQQSLNRERKLREDLETKVKEASESSGLFISYVREKLGL